MFTGIVQSLCPVVRVEPAQSLRRLVVDLGALADGVALGASVAVNGTCLTATAVAGTLVSFDVIGETLQRTNLGMLNEGSRVNVERSFRVGDEVGGHILSGHVSGVAVLRGVDQAENRRDLHFSVPPEFARYLLHKGFVALDGASLTIAAVDHGRGEITVCLIPETIARTTLGRIVVGDRVNLEVDAQTQAIVDTVERVMADPAWRARLTGGATD
ncbi:MAG: riboflavin synthase subunit alpha [Pseudomonadales bacterium]|nr:riboflavin synthase subunit alpha [Pseudomonadales bacterium]